MWLVGLFFASNAWLPGRFPDLRNYEGTFKVGWIIVPLPSCWSARGAVHRTDEKRGEHGTDTKFIGRCYRGARIFQTGWRFARLGPLFRTL